MRIHKKGIKIFCLATITCVLGGYLLTASDAQRGPRGEGGPRGFGGPGGFDPEQMERNWILQADSVASTLGLNEDAADQLTEAYSDARQDLQDKMSKMRESGGGWEGVREARDQAANAFKTALGSILEPEQAEKAFESLGGLSFRTDMGTNALSDILEDRDKLLSAVGILLKAEGNRPFGRGRPGEGSQDRRAERESAREKLYQELGTVLSAEQLEEFKSSFERFGRRGPRGGGDREGRRPESQ